LGCDSIRSFVQQPAAPVQPVIADEFLPPNTILFVQNIPVDTPAEEITELFQK